MRHSVLVSLVLLNGIAVLVGAREEMDEALYLFLSSQLAPPPSCPQHELYQMCSGNCSDCARRGSCPADCSFKGCDCLHNFARMEPQGPCQPVHLCPVPECGEREVFRECGAVCERCEGVRCRMLHCEHRCYCAHGHLRDEKGRCVPEDQCPQAVSCLRDEAMGLSGRVDEYCLRDEATSNATETRDRCYCREGFSRNAVGHCVRDELCERVLCPGVEVYQSCPRKCRVTCRGDSSDCEEDGQCFPGCFCPDGYLVDDFRRCVPEHQCPITETTYSATPLISTTEVQVPSSSPPPADEEEIPELPEDEYVRGATTTTLPITPTADTDEPTPTPHVLTPHVTHTQDTSRSPATTTAKQGEKKSTTTAPPQITVQDSTRADDEATTFEETRAHEVVTTTTTGTTTPTEEEKNDF